MILKNLVTPTMGNNTYIFHTKTFERLVGVISKAMFGITKKTYKQIMPKEFFDIKVGDLVFVSELRVTKNALFGPFYVVKNRPGIKGQNYGTWIEIDYKESKYEELAYWVEIERKNYCILFDKLLAQQISIVWPQHWRALNVNLPSWGLVKDKDAQKLVDFSLQKEHQEKARDFLNRHFDF